MGGDSECADFARLELPDPLAEFNLFVPEGCSQSSGLACSRCLFGDDFNNEPEFDRGPLADPFAFDTAVILELVSSSLNLKNSMHQMPCIFLVAERSKYW